MTGSKPYKDLPDHEVSAAFSEGRYPDLESVSAFRNTIMKCWTQSYATVKEARQDVKLEDTFNSLAKLQKLTIRTAVTIKEPRISRFHALLSRQSILFPFLLTIVSLIPFVGWVRRWRLLQ